MTNNFQLDEAKVAPSMPTLYVDFVRQLWRAQANESRHTWSRGRVAARRPVFLELLASERLCTELRRVYDTPVGPKIAEALTRQAINAPELWMSEDKRSKKERATQFTKLRTAINRVSKLLDQDRTLPNERDTAEKAATGRHRSTCARLNKVDARAHRPIPASFENVFSEPLIVRHWHGWMRQDVPDLKGIRLQLSLYQFHQIARAFDKLLGEAIENINRLRTHVVDDPIFKYMGQITKGHPNIRHAALLLDECLDRFTDDFTKLKRKLSRDKLLSAFVLAIYPKTKDDIVDYKAINRICGPRRKVLNKI